MKIDLAQCVNKGMQRDYSMDKASQEFAYENRNIRITTTGDNSFLSVTNEKSTENIPIHIELKEEYILYYDLVKEYEEAEDGMVYIKDAKIVFDKPVPENLTMTIHYMADGSGYNKDFRIRKGFLEWGITRYIPTSHRDTLVSILLYKSPESAYFPIWKDHEIVPTSNNIGTVLGATTIGESVVIFSRYFDSEDAIIVGNFSTNSLGVTTLNCKYLFYGDLNFKLDHPIECTTSYEGENVQKVYWVDGVNQPRVINICDTFTDSSSFDFAPRLPDNINVTIEKEYNGSGNFTSGVVQYFITFYNKFSAETNVAYESPLYYISPENRGGEPNEKQTCSFKISLSTNFDNFKFARVYSLIRTSINATPQAFIVKDVELPEDGGTIQIIDNNILNTPIAATDVMFLGGNTIIAGTIEQKDNTLFLGNINEVTTDVTANIKLLEDKGTLEFGSKFIPSNGSNNIYYPYTPNLDLSSQDIKTFKYLEWYKIGIQFQLNSGEWTSVVELGNVQNTIKPNEQASITPYSDSTEFDNGMWLPAVVFKPSTSFIESLQNLKDVRGWRLVMAEHTPETRTIKAQGLVIPTVFNLKERTNNTCYASPLWTLNTLLYGEHLGNVDYGHEKNYGYTDTIEMYPFFHLPISIYNIREDRAHKLNTVIDNSVGTKTTEGTYLVNIKPTISIDRTYGFSNSFDVFKCIIRLGVKKEGVEGTSYYDIILYDKSYGYGVRRQKLKELSDTVNKMIWADIWNENIGDITVSALNNITETESIFKSDEIPSGDSLRDDYGVTPTNDKTISLPTYIRDIVYNKNTEAIEAHGNQYFIDANICNFISPDLDNVDRGLKFRIVGSTDILNSISDYYINVEDNTIGTTTYKAPVFNFNTFKMPVLGGTSYYTGIKNFPLWPYNNRLYYLHYWNNSGNIVEGKFNLKNKSFANMWVCGDTTYESPQEYGNVSNLYKVDNETVAIGTKIYKAEYQNVLFPRFDSDSKYTISYIGGDNEDDYPSRKPVNETVPLDILAEAIIDSVGGNEPLEEKVSDLGSVNIKYKSARHIVFQLPDLQRGYQSILPGYAPNYTDSSRVGNGVLYSDTKYPIGGSNINFILQNTNIIGETPEVGFTDNVRVSIDMYGSLNIGGDNIETMNFSADEFIEPLVKISDITTLSQPNTEDIFNSFFEDTVNSQYEGTSILLCVGEINDSKTYKYLVLNSLHMTGATRTNVELTATLNSINIIEPISITDTDRTYYLKEVRGTNEFEFSEFELFKYKAIESNKKILIGEFYNDYNSETFFSGDSKNCKFIPISNFYSIDATEGWGLEGDTYYQRYDNVRIFGASETDTNQNIDAVSFVLETYKNLDGDYRKQRGRLDTTNLTIDNTNNILNSVYSQNNSYTSSNIIDEKFDDATHPTLYVWSLSKQNLANVDTWTSINLASSLKLDGDKGALTKIKRWNNHLLAFQEKGLAVINFNQQTTISTNEGVPVEIANSGKVTGHYYISSTQGCKNKWSVADSPYGLYFIDSYNKSINVFGSEGIKSLSTINLFQDWIVENELGNVWDTTNNGGFKTFYDPIHKEVYFVNDKEALCYNELLGQFTSFYDYGELNSMLLFNGHIYGIKGSKIHRMFEGEDYCRLFNDTPSKYSMTYKINRNPFIDKIWTNIEYRADVFRKGNISDNNSVKVDNETFDTLEVWNEYQKGTTELMGSKYPKAKNKFRIWRADIPRDSSDIRKINRIRNPWIMLKLEKSTNTEQRMEFHDLIVKYLQ